MAVRRSRRRCRPASAGALAATSLVDNGASIGLPMSGPAQALLQDVECTDLRRASFTILGGASIRARMPPVVN